MNNLRPTMKDGAVVARAVEFHSDVLIKWGARTGAPLDLTKVSEAVSVSPDGYSAAKLLENQQGVHADTRLVWLLDNIYRGLSRFVTCATHEWVMRSKTRFPAKEGNTIRFKRDGSERHGVVLAVVAREARAIVEDVSDRSTAINVFAEDVTKVISKGDARRPNPSPTNPTGGTPVAARLREAA